MQKRNCFLAIPNRSDVVAAFATAQNFARQIDVGRIVINQQYFGMSFRRMNRMNLTCQK